MSNDAYVYLQLRRTIELRRSKVTTVERAVSCNTSNFLTTPVVLDPIQNQIR